MSAGLALLLQCTTISMTANLLWYRHAGTLVKYREREEEREGRQRQIDRDRENSNACSKDCS